MTVKISQGNSKLGQIKSVSLPASVTCRKDAPCKKKCYALKLSGLRPSVRAAYEHNLNVLKTDPVTYWREVEASIMMSRFFRFHVSGDIPDNVYFAHIVEIAEKNPHCEILCFTKKYDIVNDFLDFGGKLPNNLHMVFSVWKGLPVDNPHLLPEAHLRYRDGSTTASDAAKECRGNCSDCAITDSGCWSLKHGEQVVFNEH